MANRIPWKALCGGAVFALSLPMASAEILELPENGDSVLGTPYNITTHYGETTLILAQVHEIGYHELLSANPDVHTWMPGEGTLVHIPRQYILPGKARAGLVLNLAELRLYYYETTRSGKPQVRTYPISAGRVDWVTPIGITRVLDRLENPNWYPPKSVILEHEARGDKLEKVVPPGADNPLGQYALMLEADGYFIHGTNRDQGIGMRVTHGCIRMRSKDIAELIYRVPVDTPVEIISMPIKIGFMNGVVYMEAHPEPLEEFPMPVKNPVLEETDVLPALHALEEQLPAGDYVIYWEQVMEIARKRLGIPVAVGWDRSVHTAVPKGKPELLWSLDKPTEDKPADPT